MGRSRERGWRRRVGLACAGAVIVLLAVAIASSGGAASAYGGALLQAKQRASARGVIVTVDAKGRVVIRFTKAASKLYRPIAGKRLRVDCGVLDLENGEINATGRFAAYATGKRVMRPRVPLSKRRFDYCSIIRTPVCPQVEVVSVPFSTLGKHYLDERATTRRLFAALHYGFTGDPALGWRFRTPADYVQEISKYLPVVALAAPGDTPSGRLVGYWSDGRQHAETVQRTATGKRFFVELNEQTLSTNTIAYLSMIYGCG